MLKTRILRELCAKNSKYRTDLPMR